MSHRGESGGAPPEAQRAPARQLTPQARREESQDMERMQWAAGDRVTVMRLCTALLVAGVVPAAMPPAAHAAAVKRSFAASADAAATRAHARARYGRTRWLRAGGAARWRSYLRFRVRATRRPVHRAVLVLRASPARRASLEVRVALGHRWRERRITAAAAPRAGRRVGRLRVAPAAGGGGAGGHRVAVDVTPAVTGAGTFDFVLTAPGRRSVRLASREARRGGPRLVITPGAAPASGGGPGAGGPTRPPGAVP